MQTLRLIRERTKARSLGYNVVRVLNIYRRYGLSNEKVRNILVRFVTDLHRYQIQPTFPVTASTLQRSPALFQQLESTGVEFAIHGYRHVDYTQLSMDAVHCHWQRAVSIFRRNRIRHNGFRFPFLRRDLERMNSLGAHPLDWDSSDVISWPLPESIRIPSLRFQDYHGILNTYQVKEAKSHSSLPYFLGNLVEIPVSMPDDDILVERLGLDSDDIEASWLSVFHQCRRRAGSFVLQLHPERYLECRKPLNRLLVACRDDNRIWSPTLSELAAWWRERAAIQWTLTQNAPDLFQLDMQGDGRCQLLMYHKSSGNNQHPIYGLWEPVVDPRRIPSSFKPVIGVDVQTETKSIDFLKQEGYLFEVTEPGVKYALQLPASMAQNGSIALQGLIDKAKGPLLRIWRWPRGIRSVFVVTGDIDALDFWDYWIRFYGNE